MLVICPSSHRGKDFLESKTELCELPSEFVFAVLISSTLGFLSLPLQGGIGLSPGQGARIAHALRLKNEEKIRTESHQSSRFHKLQVYESVFFLTPCHGFSSKSESSEEAATFLIQNSTASFLRDARRLNLTLVQCIPEPKSD